MSRVNWTREQLIVALDLYWKVPYNKISGTSNPLIKQTAEWLGKTSGALAFKLMNFSSLDVHVQNKGKGNASRLDRQIWEEFYERWEALTQANDEILAQLSGGNVPERAEPEDFISEDRLPTESISLQKVRRKQHVFRQRILANYGERCCISGLAMPELLVASHIIPWAKDEKNRMNPHNGLCLNALLDRAFDKGLMTITTDYKVKLSSKLQLASSNDNFIRDNVLIYQDMVIDKPQRFLPEKEFLIYHQSKIFLG